MTRGQTCRCKKTPKISLRPEWKSPSTCVRDDSLYHFHCFSPQNYYTKTATKFFGSEMILPPSEVFRKFIQNGPHGSPLVQRGQYFSHSMTQHTDSILHIRWHSWALNILGCPALCLLLLCFIWNYPPLYFKLIAGVLSQPLLGKTALTILISQQQHNINNQEDGGYKLQQQQPRRWRV